MNLGAQELDGLECVEIMVNGGRYVLWAKIIEMSYSLNFLFGRCPYLQPHDITVQ